MIKIQEHLNRGNVEKFLNDLSVKHWEFLNPKTKDRKKYKKISLIEKCKKIYRDTNSDEYIKEYANDSKIVARRHKNFFNLLKKNNSNFLKQIVLCRPEQFSLHKVEILSILEEDDLFYNSSGKICQTKFGKLLSEQLFNYKNFRESQFCKELLVEIGFRSATCPYCNYNNLDIIDVHKKSSRIIKSKAYLDLDHFYPKSQNPFFAVSFFNLIPSCHSCNSTDKGDKPFSIATNIHPYYEAFDDFYRFKISLVVCLGHAIDDIIIERKVAKHLDNSVTDLNLEGKYKNNFEDAHNLVKYFLDNKKRHMGTKFESSFIESFFELKGVPREKNSILSCPKGKMYRDLLLQVDVENILGIT